MANPSPTLPATRTLSALVKESLEQALFQLWWDTGPVVGYYQDAMAIRGGSVI